MLPLVVVLVQPPGVLNPHFSCKIYQYLCAVEALYTEGQHDQKKENSNKNKKRIM
jgi:hypothetical protein